MIKLKNTYRDLPEVFWKSATPSAGISPTLLKFNAQLSSELGMNLEDQEEILNLFSGQSLPTNLAPIAMAYSGHQFGHFNPTLGDGRAILLGEIEDKDGKLFDIQLKGAGRTPYSRGGDGKSSLGPVIREYILSEAMNNLNIPTTRSLCAVLSGETVFREEELPGAIFTRVSKSHIRVGTFEYFSSRGLEQEVRILAEYLIDREFKHLKESNEKYLELFREISQRKLDLVAKWMGIGFIHGVMNTDNTSVIGETIDYGPCAFMDNFEFNKVYSSIDRNSRYAYNNQGQIAQWNLTSLANCFIPLISENKEESVQILKKELSNLSVYFDSSWIKTMGMKIGIYNADKSNLELINNFLVYLQKNNLDFTNTFRELPLALENNEAHLKELKEFLIKQDTQIEKAYSLMNSVNPSIIPRNHLIQDAIDKAINLDYSRFNELLKVTKTPYEENLEYQDLMSPPTKDQIVHKTFCGT
jgi:uncharacterized protein YdiU (UPF0061 family)